MSGLDERAAIVAWREVSLVETWRGHCPVAAGSVVETRWSDGSKYPAAAAGSFAWCGFDARVTHYRRDHLANPTAGMTKE